MKIIKKIKDKVRDEFMYIIFQNKNYSFQDMKQIKNKYDLYSKKILYNIIAWLLVLIINIITILYYKNQNISYWYGLIGIIIITYVMKKTLNYFIEFLLKLK